MPSQVSDDRPSDSAHHPDADNEMVADFCLIPMGTGELSVSVPVERRVNLTVVNVQWAGSEVYRGD